MERRKMGERIISNTQILAEIRAEREALEKIKGDLGQPRRAGSTCDAENGFGSPLSTGSDKGWFSVLFTRRRFAAGATGSRTSPVVGREPLT